MVFLNLQITTETRKSRRRWQSLSMYRYKNWVALATFTDKEPAMTKCVSLEVAKWGCRFAIYGLGKLNGNQRPKPFLFFPRI